jgi:two-component system, NarL family, nitrate/nitrite response regulator NarL
MRILLADHHILFREGLIGLLAHEPDIEIVGAVGLARDAVQKAIMLKPDILLLDLDLPDQSGIEVLKTIYTRDPEINIVILTAAMTNEQLISAVQNGAKGYLLKDIAINQLIESLRGVMRSETAFRRSTIRRIVDTFAENHNKALESDNLEQLTDRERDVLEHICQGASNIEIAHALLISENTVKAHVRKILSKLNLQNRREARKYALKLGFVNLTGRVIERNHHQLVK